MKFRIVISLFGLVILLHTSGAQTVLTSTNSVWKYLANGTSLDGVDWRTLSYPDSSWSSGAGRLGFGGDGEQTVIGSAPNGYVTFYFRHVFAVAGLSNIASLTARYQRDDGVILYLNGIELFRANMPAGPVGSATQALSAITGTDEASFITTTLSPTLLLEGANILAAEVHQSHPPGSLSSDLGWYLELRGGPPPQPPIVTLTNPGNGAILQADTVTMNATATDSDGTISLVQFLSGNVTIGVDTTAPYSTLAQGTTPGTYNLRAVAIDSQGLRTTSAPVSITVVAPLPSLIPFGATWRYLDTGANQGFVWTTPGFDDSSWFTGVAELGFGDSDEATLTRRSGTSGVTVTTYFRRNFVVPNPAAISNLVLRLVRDDGAIVYINGIEVLRDNLTNNIVDYLTLAALSVEDDPIVVTNISPAVLVSATNIIAVEIHQQSTGSSDISFDLQLIANPGAHPPVVQITTPLNGTSVSSAVALGVAANAYDIDGAVVQVQFLVDGIELGTPDGTAPYSRTTTGLAVGRHAIQAIATDNSGLTGTASVTVIVPPDPITVRFVRSNAVWRYLDDGSDQGTAWRQPTFIDTNWRSGAAELGFGDNDEATRIRQTNEFTLAPNITFYFRHEFEATAPVAITNLLLDLRRDDGAVVYLNGTEIFRSNMTNGPGIPILVTDFAGNNTGSETAFNSAPLDPALLVPGRNVIAVEVHQQNLTSSDVSFELQLVGQQANVPLLSIVYGEEKIRLSWTPETNFFVLQEALSPNGPWTASGNQINPQTILADGDARYFRLCGACP